MLGIIGCEKFHCKKNKIAMCIQRVLSFSYGLKYIVFLAMMGICLFGSIQNVCFADAYTKKISDLGALRFIQEYNANTTLNVYFSEPTLVPSSGNGPFSRYYDFLEAYSNDFRYKLNIRVDKEGYLNSFEIVGVKSYNLREVAYMMKTMMLTGRVLNEKQTNTLFDNFRQDSRNKGYYYSQLMKDIHTMISAGVYESGRSGSVMGISPTD